MNYLQIDKASISNGPGVRVVLWVAGCTLNCKGCQNPESWNFNAGKLFDENAKQELFDTLKKPYIRGITISGGHPLEARNILCVYNLIKEIKNNFPTKDIWLYTGWSLSINDITPPYENKTIENKLFALCDVIVDGPYIEKERDITLMFRGSANQRLIDVKKTMEQNKIITIQN